MLSSCPCCLCGINGLQTLRDNWYQCLMWQEDGWWLWTSARMKTNCAQLGGIRQTAFHRSSQHLLLWPRTHGAARSITTRPSRVSQAKQLCLNLSVWEPLWAPQEGHHTQVCQANPSINFFFSFLSSYFLAGQGWKGEAQVPSTRSMKACSLTWPQGHVFNL